MNIWTCLTCYNDYTGPTMRCAVCCEPLCTNCRHQHTKREIRMAAFVQMDAWLENLHKNHPARFYLLTVVTFAFVIIPVLLMVMFR